MLIENSEKAMIRIISRSSLALTTVVIACLCISAAHADAYDDARQTFQKDIPHFFQNDVPHFFQDDIPCAFGGQPTSHTKRDCKSPENSARHHADGTVAQPGPPSDADEQPRQAPVYDQ